MTEKPIRPPIRPEHIDQLRAIAIATGTVSLIDVAQVCGLNLRQAKAAWESKSRGVYHLSRFREELAIIESEANLAARKRLDIAKPRREPLNTGVNHKPSGNLTRDGTHRPPGRPPKRPHELAPGPSRPSTVPISFAKPAATPVVDVADDETNIL